jgi:hypothetical protein
LAAGDCASVADDTFFTPQIKRNATFTMAFMGCCK